MDYSVTVYGEEMVTPALPLQHHRLPLSNIDLVVPHVNASVFFCFKSEQIKTHANTLTRTLKDSLSEALVSFYPLAGRMIMNAVGEPEVLCNSHGVPFGEAHAHVHLARLDLSKPDGSVQGKLVPPENSVYGKHHDGAVPICCVQVTKFECGSMVLGCTFDHRVADAFSFNMFLVAWAEIARKQKISMIPSFRRSLLDPRDPPSWVPMIDRLYTVVPSLPNKSQPPSPSLVTKIYHLPANSIRFLQDLATGIHGQKRSKLVAFSAHLWRLIAATGARDETRRETMCKMGIVVDGRSRLQNMGLPSNYFGNVLLLPFAEASGGDLMRQSLSMMAELIHNCIHEAANEEPFRSLIDWVEIRRSQPILATIYCGGESLTSEAGGPAVVISSGLRFPVYDIQFGWGKPVFGSYHFPWGGVAGYVMPLPSPGRDGSWVVYMHLPQLQLDAIESHPDCLFKPISAEVVGLCGEKNRPRNSRGIAVCEDKDKDKV